MPDEGLFPVSAEYSSASAVIADLAALQERASSAAMRLSASAGGLRQVVDQPLIAPRRRLSGGFLTVLILAAIALTVL